MDEKFNYPDLAKKLAEIKALNDPDAERRALEMLSAKKGMGFAKDMNKMVTGGKEGSNILKTISGDEFTDKIAKLRALKGLGTKGLKSIPVLGSLAGLGAAIGSGDVAAAVPFLGDSEMAGPQAGSPEEMLESGKLNQEQFMNMMQNNGGRARAEDLNSLINKAKQFQEKETDFTGENSFNRMNNMKQVQPMDEEQLNKFNKLKQFLGK